LCGVLSSAFDSGRFIYADDINFTNASYILVEDFSWIHPYNNFTGLNPFGDNATGPLWNTAGYNWSQPGDIMYHTNNLGYYVGSLPEGLAQVELGGFRSIYWNSNSGTRWWYSLTSIPERYIWTDASSSYYLTFRVKGQNGGELFNVKFETRTAAHELDIENYVNVTTDWQTVRIPLSDFQCSNLNEARAVTLVFNGAQGGSGKTIYFDDIMFMPQNNPVPEGDGLIKPESQGNVKISNARLLVNEEPYLIKGIGYQPTPIGDYPDELYFNPVTLELAERDLPIIEDMGANTIRTWNIVGEFKNGTDNTLMDVAQDNGIKVCAGYWIPYEISFYNEWALEHLEDDFQEYVDAFKDHPSLLMWVIGNENNCVNGYEWPYYAFLNILAKDAYTIEGDNYHPVSLVEADIGTLGEEELGSDDAHLNYVDVIGINSYRGKQFNGLFQEYENLTQKPVWISEFGVDAWHTYNIYDPENGVVNQFEQTDYAVKAFVDIVRNSYQYHGASDICLGGSVMEYSDEWWKDRCSIGQSPASQDYGGFVLSGLPDGFANEEWWGTVSVEDAAFGPDIIMRRNVSYNLYSTSIGGYVDPHRYPGAIGVMIMNTGQVANIDEDGLYYFTQLHPGAYTLTLIFRENPVHTPYAQAIRRKPNRLGIQDIFIIAVTVLEGEITVVDFR
jgi:hypothetical protein